MPAARMSLRRKPGPRRSAAAMPAIAHAVDAFDRIERGIERRELAADALDVRGDGAVVDREVGFPHQRVAVFHMAGKFRQRMHDPEFSQRELDLLLPPMRLQAL